MDHGEVVVGRTAIVVTDPRDSIRKRYVAPVCAESGTEAVIHIWADKDRRGCAGCCAKTGVAKKHVKRSRGSRCDEIRSSGSECHIAPIPADRNARDGLIRL